MIYDVAIIGNGLIGKLLALSLKQAVPSLKLCMIDKNTVAPNNNRAIALSMPTVNFLEKQHVWTDTLQQNSGVIHNIAVAMDTHTPLELVFNGTPNMPLGYNVEHTGLLTALDYQLQRISDIHFELGSAINEIDFTDAYAKLYLNRQHIKARLVIGADGRHSFLRRQFAKFRTIHYYQDAFTAKVHHTTPHNHQAYEFFIPQGALAFIPLANSNESTMVWSLKQKLAPSTHEIETILKHIAHTHLGEVTLANALQAYPLSSYVSTKRTGTRWGLVGDAATTIHPVAGQGFNLGVRDIIKLTEILTNTHRLGLDIGGNTALKAYERQRKIDQQALYGITNFAAKPLTTQNIFLRKLFKIGLKLTQKAPSLLSFLNHSAQKGL